MKEIPEILAPAGDLACLKAAVSAGADAVYLGGKAFNARRSAAGFTTEDLREAVRICRPRGVKLHLTLNTLVKQKEWPALLDYMDEVLPLGIDAVIVQDPGVAMAVKSRYPDLALHASTQMAVQDLDGVLYMEELGFKRVVLAREVTLREVELIRAHTNMELEVFIHGALCYSYSGRCLLSSFHGGRSGNRGACAQPCRLPYTAQAGESGYFMNLRDQCAAPHLEALSRAGVHSFKIEGRLKSEAYVAGVTAFYRCLLDEYKETGHVHAVSEEEMRPVMQLFNRGGFTDGYWQDKRDMIERGSPKHQGIPVGRVVQSQRQRVTIQTGVELHSGDQLEVHSGRVPHPQVRLSSSMLSGKQKATFFLKEPVQVGDTVWRVVDPVWQQALVQKAAALPLVDLAVSLSLQIGRPALLESSGHSIEGPVVEAARERGLEEQVVRRQMSKLGGTGYRLASLSLQLEPGSYISIAALNQMRRDLLSAIENTALRQPCEAPLPSCRRQAGAAGKRALQIAISTEAQWDEMARLCDERVTAWLPRMEGFEKADKAALLRLAAGIVVVPSLPPVGREAHRDWIEKEIRAWQAVGVNQFEANVPGQVRLIRRLGARVWAGPGLAVMNQAAAAFWQEQAEMFVASPELTGRELLDLQRPERCCVLAYGRIPYMITEQCAAREVRGRCAPTGSTVMQLTDRRQEAMLVQTHCRLCYSEILSEKPVSLLGKLTPKHPETWRVVLTTETRQEISALWKALAAERQPSYAVSLGHWEKGVD